MDEVWVVSLCLTFLAFVVLLLSLRKTDRENESTAKVKERSAAPVFASAQPPARFMEMTTEDIDKTLERLGTVLGAEPEKQQPTRHQERKKQNGNEDRSGSESQVAMKQKNTIQENIEHPTREKALMELESLEHPPVTSSTRNIMEQIEQAVQETPEHNKERSDYIRVRRAPPAPRLGTPVRDDVPQSRTMYSSD